jgi:hypothetical protein
MKPIVRLVIAVCMAGLIVGAAFVLFSNSVLYERRQDLGEGYELRIWTKSDFDISTPVSMDLLLEGHCIARLENVTFVSPSSKLEFPIMKVKEKMFFVKDYTYTNDVLVTVDLVSGRLFSEAVPSASK